MSKDLRPVGAKDLEDLKTDPDGNLYWKGKQVRTGGWTMADRIALGAAIVAVLTFLAGLAKDYKDILKNIWPSTATSPATSPSPASPSAVSPGASAPRPPIPQL